MSAVNPPFSRMIEIEYKKIEFRNKVIKEIHKDNTIWFYETKNKGGIGKIIGSATIVAVIPLRALFEPYGTGEQFIEKDIHFINYCLDRGIKIPPVPCDAWVRGIRNLMHCEFGKYSYAFNKTYLKEIGWSGKYAILFKEYKENYLSLDDFTSIKSSEVITRPPQSMMWVERKI